MNRQGPVMLTVSVAGLDHMAWAAGGKEGPAARCRARVTGGILGHTRRGLVLRAASQEPLAQLS